MTRTFVYRQSWKTSAHACGRLFLAVYRDSCIRRLRPQYERQSTPNCPTETTRNLETKKMFHIFHVLQPDMVFEIVNPFSWKVNAISSEKSCLSWGKWRFPVCWILIGQFKFTARHTKPYAWIDFPPKKPSSVQIIGIMWQACSTNQSISKKQSCRPYLNVYAQNG